MSSLEELIHQINPDASANDHIDADKDLSTTLIFEMHIIGGKNYKQWLVKNDHQHPRKIWMKKAMTDNIILNNSTFKQEISNIYPRQLELKRITEMDSRLSYLNLEVNNSDRRFTTTVFDKSDNFSFHIVNFPHMDSNIP
jgi:hypothetical protein